MNALTKLTSATVAAIAVVCIAAPSQAAQFAAYVPVNSGSDFHWDNSSSTLSTTAADGSAGMTPVRFSFVDAALQSAGLTNLLANFSLTATVSPGNPAQQFGGISVQPGLTGSFAFTTTQNLVVNGTTYNAGSVLLGGSFNSGFIQGAADTGSVNGSTAIPGGSVSFTSAFLDLSKATSESFALTLLDAVPDFGGTTGGEVDSFNAASTGNFSASGVTVAPAPEPATWALMIIGFGGMGVMLRNRRRMLSLV
jgi:hypothetical protein